LEIKDHFHLSYFKKDKFKKDKLISRKINSFSIIGAKIWNSIPEIPRKLPKHRFKKKTTESLFQIFLKRDSYVDIDTLLNEMKRIENLFLFPGACDFVSHYFYVSLSFL